MWSDKEKRIGNLILGIVALVLGLLTIKQVLGNISIFGLEFAFTQVFGDTPAVLFSIGTTIGGIYLIYSSLKKPIKKQKNKIKQ